MNTPRKPDLKRREFFGLSIAVSGLALTHKVGWAQAPAAKGITEKDILRPGEPATIANYCENPKVEASRKKYCPMYDPAKEQSCKNCMFYNKDNSKTTFKGKEYARCQLLADPKKAQFVEAGAWCATYVKQQG